MCGVTGILYYEMKEIKKNFCFTLSVQASVPFMTLLEITQILEQDGFIGFTRLLHQCGEASLLIFFFFKVCFAILHLY